MIDEKRLNYYEYLDCYVGDIEDGKLYVVSILFGIVLEYDLKDFTYKVLSQINLPDSLQLVRINSIIKTEHFLYMTLLNSWNVFEYDIENKRMEIYGTDFEYIDGEELVIGSYMYQDRIWLFPNDVRQKIKVFHIKNKEFTVCTSVEEILKQKGYKIKKGSLICLDIFQEKNKCFLAVYDSHYILELNLETEKCNIYEVKCNAGIETMSYKNGQYWISYRGSKTVERWSPADGILETYEPKKICTQDEWTYRYVSAYKEKVIIVPTRDKIVCLIDKRTQQETVLEYSEDIQRVHNKERWMFYGYVEYNDKIILLPFSMTHFIVIDLENQRLESYPSKFDANVIYEYYVKPRLPKSVFWENDIFDLSKYLDVLTEYNYDIEERISGIGEKVWMKLR